MMKKAICAIVLICHSFVFVGCAAGVKQHQEGIEALESGDYETSIRSLEEAVRQDPGNMTYRLDLKTKREQAIQQLMAEGDSARAAGDFAAAASQYNRVLGIENRNGRALRGLDAVAEDRIHAQMVAEAQAMYDRGEVDEAIAGLRAVLSEDPGVYSARTLLEKIDAAKGPVTITPRLRTINDAPVTLQFRDANTQMIFEVLSRQTGINFIFDKDVRSDGKTTIFVQNVPIEQAIDLVLGQNQLGRQILSENMVLIYPNTPVKQLEYQDQVIKTFYMTNADPKQFSEMLKTMLNVKTVFVEDRSDAVIIRDTPEIIRMAENLLASIDLPESEVMLEVEILEITRSQLEQLGIQYPTALGLSPTPLAGDPLVLADLRDQDSTTITVTPVPVTIDLAKEVGVSNLLASPRIRARNHETAKILIGQRVPVITNSVTPTNNNSSVVTGSVQYVDVGLKLEVEPTIHLDNEIAIKVDLEVSNIIREIFNPTSGTLAYQIGTRNATTVLRLRNGETQILAGLIQDIDRVTSNRVPGLGDMPILGRLFGTDRTSDEKTEIVMSITPRIIRAQPRPASEHTEFWYGTESSLRSAPLVTTSSNSRGSTSSASSASRNSATGASRRGPGDSNTGPLARSDAPPPARITLDWDGPGQVSVGQDFDVELTVDSATDLASLRAQLRYDQAALELSSVDVGDFLPADVRSAVKPTIQERAGRVQLDIASTGSSPASGSGSIVVLHFKALTPRPGTMIAVQQFAAQGVDNLAVPVMAPKPLVVVVAP
jgi:general secretion pathway protein D